MMPAVDAGGGRPRLVIRGAEVHGQLVDVQIEDGTITAISDAFGARPQFTDTVINASGRALIPGLHDHHIHVLALCAARTSVRVGPDDVRDADGFADRLRAATLGLGPGVGVRAIGYHESVAGALDRVALDALMPDRPVRVQHRSGALWILNTAALRLLPTGSLNAADLESGRLFRSDASYGGEAITPSQVGDTLRSLLRMGLTGLTDLTPSSDPAAFHLLAEGRRHTGLELDVFVTGSPAALDAESPLPLGPVKIILDDVNLPDLDELVAVIRRAHLLSRRVAIHTVTRTTVLFAVTAFELAGTLEGDRLEHGAVIPLETLGPIRALGLTVVTQPALVSERGDDYRRDVEADDLAHLWRCGSLVAAGIPVGLGSDAPYGTADPWAVIRAATSRVTRSGLELGEGERIGAQTALERFWSQPLCPGGPPRQVSVGAPARLVLLNRTLSEMLEAPTADAVEAVIVGDEVVSAVS